MPRQLEVDLGVPVATTVTGDDRVSGKPRATKAPIAGGRGRAWPTVGYDAPGSFELRGIGGQGRLYELGK
jgi:hypothetical protein